MGCSKPLIRFYSPENKDISGRVYTLSRFCKERAHKELKYEDLMYRKDVMLIPCGQCIGCRIMQREDWTTRIEMEDMYTLSRKTSWNKYIKRFTLFH